MDDDTFSVMIVGGELDHILIPAVLVSTMMIEGRRAVRLHFDVFRDANYIDISRGRR